jgi:saccharopine dehydrogenase-like NADP-dependent oxidoreductase
MKRTVLLGAGKIGRAITRFLSAAGGFDLTVADASGEAVRRMADRYGVRVATVDAAAPSELDRLLAGAEIVISALSYSYNTGIAEAALKAGASYFDLTEDVGTTRRVRQIAAAACLGQVFMPQCGLAPGFVSIVAADLARRFDSLDSVRMRVGALPQFPTNALKYNLTWSTDGLINEYCNPCEAIHEGRRIEALALEGLESFSLDGVRYEAFNTSGGLGTLCETLEGRVRELNYKTIRYLGHRELINALINDLRLREHRDMLKNILEQAVPVTYQDVVIIFCTVTGQRGGELVQISDARKVYRREIDGENWSAIQVTTAAGVCAAVDLFLSGKLPQQGFVRQEQIALSDFLANRFGVHYVSGVAEIKTIS